MQRKVAIIAGSPGGAPNGLVQRLLRDRFVVLIDHTRTMQDAKAMAERLRGSFDVAVALQTGEEMAFQTSAAKVQSNRSPQSS